MQREQKGAIHGLLLSDLLWLRDEFGENSYVMQQALSVRDALDRT
jgi:hypothetical protein